MQLCSDKGKKNLYFARYPLIFETMYEYISGRVAELAPTYAVIDVGGVGYYLNISLQTYTEIEHAEQAQLYVHHIVREDAQLLYGFASKVERELFRLLLSVSGVGAIRRG